MLVISNCIMTFAWYGHLKFGTPKFLSGWGLFGIILTSWCIAFFEYCIAVPANRIGSAITGGPFSLIQLKVIQEVITLLVFVLFTTIFFKTETLKINHLFAALCLIGAVYFAFKG